jgi:hypothetical protein
MKLKYLVGAMVSMVLFLCLTPQASAELGNENYLLKLNSVPEPTEYSYEGVPVYVIADNKYMYFVDNDKEVCSYDEYDNETCKAYFVNSDKISKAEPETPPEPVHRDKGEMIQLICILAIAACVTGIILATRSIKIKKKEEREKRRQEAKAQMRRSIR